MRATLPAPVLLAAALGLALAMVPAAAAAPPGCGEPDAAFEGRLPDQLTAMVPAGASAWVHGCLGAEAALAGAGCAGVLDLGFLVVLRSEGRCVLAGVYLPHL